MNNRVDDGPPRSRALAAVRDRFRQKSRKMTGQRQAILELLRFQQHPLTIKEVFAALPSGSCDLATVYRAIRLLERMGLVKRCDFGDGVQRYELVTEGDEGHHHHLVCTQCRSVVELSECFPAELESQIAARNGYKVVSHKLEFFGLCPRCH